MSMKRARQVSRGSRSRDADAGSAGAGGAGGQRKWSWADDVAAQPDASFVPYSMTSSFAVGALVLHAKFGKGVVTHAEGLNIDVLFEDATRRLRHVPPA